MIEYVCEPPVVGWIGEHGDVEEAAATQDRRDRAPPRRCSSPSRCRRRRGAVVEVAAQDVVVHAVGRAATVRSRLAVPPLAVASGRRVRREHTGSVGATLDQALGGHVGGQAGVGVDAVDAGDRVSLRRRADCAVHAVGAQAGESRVGQRRRWTSGAQRRLEARAHVRRGSRWRSARRSAGTSGCRSFRRSEPAAHSSTASPTRSGSASLTLGPGAGCVGPVEDPHPPDASPSATASGMLSGDGVLARRLYPGHGCDVGLRVALAASS